MKSWIAVLILIGAGAVWAVMKWPLGNELNSALSPGDARVTTAVVEKRLINFSVSAAGDIGPAEQVSVRPEINGRIDSLPVDIGDTARKGDVLFALNDRDLQIERQTREAEIEGARLEVQRAARNFQRSQELFTDKLISQELFEDTRTEHELAKNRLERAEQTLRLLEDRLSKTKIIAPFDCTILTRPVSIGQAVSGAAGFNSGTEVLTIADLNNMIVNAHVNQADVTRLALNQEVSIQIESVPGLTIKGVVERIAPQSTIKNGVKGYAARIAIKEVDPRVRPGMTATVSIPVASSPEAVAVPLAAVFTEQGERFVFVRNGSGPGFTQRRVRIGIADYDYAEVLSGLSPGDEVSLEDVRLTEAGSKEGGVRAQPENGGTKAPVR